MTTGTPMGSLHRPVSIIETQPSGNWLCVCHQSKCGPNKVGFLGKSYKDLQTTKTKG